MQVVVRKFWSVLEEIRHEGGPPPATPRCVGALAAVIANPFAGRYVAEISPFMETLKPLGLDMAARLIAMFGGGNGVPRAAIDGFGKGAIVGTAGELEHGALWHVPGGYAMRELLGNAKAIVPSTKKVAEAGGRIDIPITHINAAYVRSHFDALEVHVPDAPAADEMVLILVMAAGPRVHARVGGLQASEITGEDGLR